MKQEAIKKMNKMGQIGQILALIAKIILIIGIVGICAATIFTAFVPEDFVKVTLGGTAKVDINLDAIGVSLSEEEQENINKPDAQIADGIIDANGMEYRINDMSATEKGLTVDTSADNITVSLHNVFKVLLVGTLSLILSLVTVCFISSLCKAVRYCETPFEDNVIKKMQNLAFSLIPWAFFKSISQGMATGVLYDKMQLNLGIDLGMVLVIVIIFVITYIFKYGAVLQQESDETL